MKPDSSRRKKVSKETKLIEKLLKSLLKKVEEQAVEATHDENIDRNTKEVEKLCQKYNIKPTDGLVADLVEWKFD